MTDTIKQTRHINRDRTGPSITVNTFDKSVLLTASTAGCYFTLHLSPKDVLQLVETLSESALLMGNESAAWPVLEETA